LSRGPAEALCPETIAFVQEETLYGRTLKRKEMSTRCGISNTTALRISHYLLRMNKVNAIWVKNSWVYSKTKKC
jgi:hypothetical protein